MVKFKIGYDEKTSEVTGRTPKIINFEELKGALMKNASLLLDTVMSDDDVMGKIPQVGSYQLNLEVSADDGSVPVITHEGQELSVDVALQIIDWSFKVFAREFEEENSKVSH